MAVKSFMKSSGWAALAAGIVAMALPAAASAQDTRWRNRGGDSQVQSQAQRSQGEARQQTRSVERRAPDRAPQQQVQRGRDGNDRQQVQRTVRQGNDRQQAQRTVRQGSDPNWLAQRRAEQAAQNRRPEANRAARPGDRNRYDNDRRYDRDDRYRNQDRRPSWNNNWRRDNRYNWQNYRNTNRQVFRLNRYYSPYSNWSYRRLNIGFFLQPLFYSSSYWINDPWQYRLPEAYGPYRWVRYYNDALLVDIYTGRVVDVIHDFFW